MIRMLWPAAAVVAALALVSACASSSAVQLQDGSTAYDVSCWSGRWACTDEARNICDGGSYVVLDENEVLGVMSRNQHGELRIQCTDEHDQARAESLRSSDEGSKSPATSPADRCASAFGDAARTASDWSTRRGRPVRANAPRRAEFVGACVMLPVAAQWCLRAANRKTHADACQRAFASLDAKGSRELDELFLEPAAPSDMSSDDGGTTGDW